MSLLALTFEAISNKLERLAGFMLSFFGQPIAVDVFPEGSLLFEVYYNLSFLPLGIDNELNTFHYLAILSFHLG